MTKVKETKILVLPSQEKRIILDGLIEYINRVCSKNPRKKACVLAFLLLSSGAFACKNANAAPTDAPTNIEQLADEEELVTTKSPEASPTPSQTPVDASTITPEVTITPVPFLVIGEDDSNEMANKLLNDLNKLYLSEFAMDGFPYSKDDIIVIKMSFGDFSSFTNYYNSVEEDMWERKKAEIYNLMRNFLLDTSWIMNCRSNKMAKEKSFIAGSLDLCSRYDNSFTGKETLIFLEKMSEELSNYLNSKDELTDKAKILQDTIYNIYYNTPDLDKSLTPYKDMHPLIQMAFIYYISQFALMNITMFDWLLNSKPQSGEERYEAFELYRSFDGEYKNLKAIISGYIDSYIEAAKNTEEPKLGLSPTPVN